MVKAPIWAEVRALTTFAFRAATWAVAAVADAQGYPERLVSRGLPARLVGPDGAVTYRGGWPEDAELAPLQNQFTR